MMNKRILCAFVYPFLILCLLACSNGSGGGTTESTTNQDNPQQEDPQSPEDNSSNPQNPDTADNSVAYQACDCDWAVDDSNQSGTENGSILYPFTTVQAAVDAAVAGDTICVAKGAYQEAVTVNDKKVILCGGYPGGTTNDYNGGSGGSFEARDPSVHTSHISGQSNGPVILLVYGNTSGSVIDGFRITGGQQGIVLDDTLTWPYLNDVVIANCIIEENRNSSLSGGGLYVRGSRIKIENNVIQNNRAQRGGGIAGQVYDLELVNNWITTNEITGDHGGGAYITFSGTISGNLFKDNISGEIAGYGWGGGLAVVGLLQADDDSYPTSRTVILKNRFLGNHAQSSGGGVFIDEGADVKFSHNIVADNSAVDGGAGLYVDGAGSSGPQDLRSKALITNCTVAGNQSDSAMGDGVLVQFSDVTVRDTIFWGNADDFMIVEESNSVIGTLLVSYSISSETIDGTGNIHSDPYFANAPAHDFHLKSQTGRWNAKTTQWEVDTISSPGINTGDPVSGYSNEPSPNGGRVNLGAYGNTAEASLGQ